MKFFKGFDERKIEKIEDEALYELKEKESYEDAGFIGPFFMTETKEGDRWIDYYWQEGDKIRGKEIKEILRRFNEVYDGADWLDEDDAVGIKVNSKSIYIWAVYSQQLTPVYIGDFNEDFYFVKVEK